MATKCFDRTIADTAEQALEFIGTLLEASIEYSLIGKDLDGTIRLWNEGARLVGRRPEAGRAMTEFSVSDTGMDIRAEDQARRTPNSALSRSCSSRPPGWTRKTELKAERWGRHGSFAGPLSRKSSWPRCRRACARRVGTDRGDHFDRW